MKFNRLQKTYAFAFAAATALGFVATASAKSIAPVNSEVRNLPCHIQQPAAPR